MASELTEVCGFQMGTVEKGWHQGTDVTCVSRAARTHLLEAYVTPLRNPLPVVRIPLRATDHDVLLSIQPLIDRCYRMGAYWNSDHENVPGPELPPEERDWVTERVRAAGS